MKSAPSKTQRLPSTQFRKVVFGGSVVFFLLAQMPTSIGAAEVRLTVSEPSQVARSNWPVTSGVPLPSGALRDADHAALYDDEGKQLPLQTEALVRWPDGSIRWLLLDFPISLQQGETARLTLRYGENDRPKKLDNPLRVAETDESVTVVTGPHKFEFSKHRFRLLDRVWFDRNSDGQFSDDERITASQGVGIELTTPDGKVFRADLSACTMRVEQSGPLRACIRVEGDHTNASGKMFRYVVRLHAYRGQPFIRLDYTFINDNQAELMSKIKSLDLVFARTKGAGKHSALLEGATETPARLFQVDEQQYEINGKESGKRAAGWAAVGDEGGGLAVGVREFWQNWPKSLAVESNANVDQNARLRVGICPTFPDGFYDGKPLMEEVELYYYLRGGVYTYKIGCAKTHELWVHFLSAAPDEKQLDGFYRAVDKPLLAQVDPEYVLSTRAAGRISPADPEKSLDYDTLVNEFLDFHLKDREKQREYGLLNYGDWYWNQKDVLVMWGNLEYDLPRGFFLQYLRSGDRRFFDRATQAARHRVDVGVIHAVNKSLFEFPASDIEVGPGTIWAHCVGHTGGYYGRYTDGEYYDLPPLKPLGPPYCLGLSNTGHHWIGGSFDYYCLTGDRRALEVAVMSADYMAGLCPTPYSDHIRTVGWPLHMMLDAYEATGDKKYLAAAARQWNQLKRHFDPKKGWVVMLAYGHCTRQSAAERCRGQNGYMLGLTLSALARYHQNTQDPEVLAALTVGVNQLIRGCYSEQHKSFYLTSCIHSRGNPPPDVGAPTFLSSFALAYESALTGDREHRRICRESLTAAIRSARSGLAAGKFEGWSGAQSGWFIFTPYAFDALDRD